MKTYNIHEAKTHFSKLVRDAMAGEEIVIAKAGVPILRLDKIEPQSDERIFGSLKRHKFTMPTDEEWKRMDEEIAKDMYDGIERKFAIWDK